MDALPISTQPQSLSKPYAHDLIVIRIEEAKQMGSSLR
jgi:hypothetical protein